MIPLRFPAECFGFGVEWRGEERAAYLYSPFPLVEPEPEIEPEPEPEPTPEVPAYEPEIETPSTIEPDEQTPSSADYEALARDRSPAIIPMEHPETTITALHTPRETGTAAYTVLASSPISEVEKFLLADNRLVIDIYNAVCLIEGPFYFDATVPVSGIRASQFMDFPKVTRLVFDLVGAAEYSITLSEDRRELLVSFERNTVTEVRFTSTGVSDSVTIIGHNQPLISIASNNNPDRFVIGIANVRMDISGEQMTQGVFIHHVKVTQQNDSGLVELLVNEWPTFNIEYGENSVTIRFFRDNLTGISYDYGRREIHISRENGLYMDINAIVHHDEYSRNRYSLILPVNAEGILGNGELRINDGIIQSVSVEQDSFGHTKLVVHKIGLMSFTMHETESAYVIKAQTTRDAHPRIVVIDPGHGGSAPGAVANGLIEKNINLSITLKLMQLLEQDAGIKAYYTRTDDRDVSLEERVQFANANGDIFVSIHANAARTNTATSYGIETYYLPHENDALIGFTSEQLAKILHRNQLNTTNAFDRGVKRDNIKVLRETNIPAVLCEVGFLTHTTEAALLATEEYQWKIAYGIYNGIVEAFSIYIPRR
jgi:N-acetylmuramoyl-L-alanine amidase